MERTTHPFTPEEVMAYLDGELAPERATAAAAHLEHCAECRAVAAELRGVSQQLAAWQVEAAQEAFSESAVRAAAAPSHANRTYMSAGNAEQGDTRKIVPRGLWLWGGVLAAAAAALMAISLTPRHSMPRRGLEDGVQMRRDAEPAASMDGPIAQPGVASAPVPPPPATPMMMKDRDAATKYAEENSLRAAGAQNMKSKKSAPATGPMIIRRASLGLLTKEFESARAAMENLVRVHQGYFGQLNVATPPNAGRSLTATLRVPAAQLDPVLIDLRKLGRVEQENQSADDVTGQYVDLTARLSNARETEKRLVEILRERTGKVGDVLDVEREISGVRQQIEQMDAQRKSMENQVQYASLDLRITEEYKQSLETPAPSLGTRIHNSAVDGLLGAADLVIGLLLFLLNAGPTLLLLAAVLAWPVWRAACSLRRRYRLADAPASKTA